MPTKKKIVSKKTGTKTKKSTVDQDVKENKLLAVLCYLGILFIIPFLIKPDSKFIKFHAKQGLVLTIAWFVALVFYPVFGLGFLIQLAVIVFSIMGIVNVSEGEMRDLPIVGELAKKFKF